MPFIFQGFVRLVLTCLIYSHKFFGDISLNTLYDMKLVSKKIYIIIFQVMTFTKKFKVFDDELLDRNPEFKEVLKPIDQYLELIHLISNKPCNIPLG